MTEQLRKTRLVPPASAWRAIFGQTRLDKYLCMTIDEKLTIYATPWAKQFRCDINSLEEGDEGDDFCARTEWRYHEGLFYLYAEDFCARDLKWRMKCMPVGWVARLDFTPTEYTSTTVV